MLNLHNHFRFFAQKELSEVYIAVIIRSLAISMIGLFIPIYLYTDLGYSISKIALFFIYYTASFAVLNVFVAKFSARYGFKHSILVSSFLTIIYMALLYSLKSNIVHYSVVGIVFGASSAFYWIAFHLELARSTKSSTRGKAVSKWFFLASVFSIAGPILGAFVLVKFGFPLLFIIASILLILATVPLFLSGEVYESSKFSFNYLLKKEHFKDVIAEIGYGITIMADYLFWPILIFTLLGSYISLGWIYTAGLFLVSLITLYIGRLTKSRNARNLLKIGASFNSIAFIARIFVRTLLQIGILHIFSRVFFYLLEIPLHAIAYKKANLSRKNRVEYLVVRETAICVGRLIPLLAIMAFNDLEIAFVVAAIGSLLTMLI